jgi:hypothetical protein
MTDKKKYTNTGHRSTAFKTNPDTAWKYLVTGPARLGVKVRAKAKRDSISLRSLILGLLTRWVDGDIEHPKPERYEDLSPERQAEVRAHLHEALGPIEPDGSPADIND